MLHFACPEPLTIGSLRLATPLLLAPIAGYCDVSYRLVVRSCGGVGMACTDLLSPEGVVRENKRSMELAATCAEDSPLCMQLYGGDADRLCEAAMWAEDRGAHVIDINMGCPVDKITKRDGGSKLLCDPDRTLRIVEKIKGCLGKTPLTAKVRLGWDDEHIVAPYLARRLEEAGVAAVTVHGRTTVMQFGGQVRLEGIGEAVAAVKHIPVIGNGDVRTPEEAKRMMEVTGCAGVMIGRGALVEPWIFRDTWAYLTTGKKPEPLTIVEKCGLVRDHFTNLLRFRNEQIAVLVFRKRISWYAKTMHPCRVLKNKVREAQTAGDFEAALGEFLEWRAGFDAGVGERFEEASEAEAV